MKRKIIFSLLLLLFLLAGCGQQTAEDGKIQVVTAIFPEYDWVRQIAGENSGIEITLLVDDGMDSHSFQPSAGDMVKASQCDLLIFGGGESDGWLDKLLESGGKPGQQVIRLLPMLGDRAYEEEHVEGMEHGELESDEAEMDEHVWLSLKNATLFCQEIADALCQLDPSHEDLYRANLEDYLVQIQQLDERYQQTVDGATKKTIIVCDRFPFRYLVEDYGLDYYAAFPGCSAETGASFETVIFLGNKAKEEAVSALLITETGDGKLAQTVADNAMMPDIPVLTLNAMQSVSAEQAKGTSYLGIMEENLRVLEQALN